jgi:manganese oxidase
VQPRGFDKKVQKLIPGYMTMGAEGMGEMGAMHMPIPENSVAMVGGYGPFDFITMGGMFTVLKVREGITSYEDPGWYDHPAGTVAMVASIDEMERDGITQNLGK